MGNLANSADPDEMQHNSAFHQGLHYNLFRLKPPSGTEIHHNLETSTCDPLKYRMGNPYSLHPYVWENPSEYNNKYCIVFCNKLFETIINYLLLMHQII